MAVSIETRIRGLGLVIPEPAGSKALYRPTTRTARLWSSRVRGRSALSRAKNTWG